MHRGYAKIWRSLLESDLWEAEPFTKGQAWVDLLTTSFGPNFTVRLVTQDEESGKETLDIIVIRPDGSETLIENLSGGEKVWVMKALRLATPWAPEKDESKRVRQAIFERHSSF